MKYLITLAVIVLLSACGNSRNERMAQLLNEKKSIETEIPNIKQRHDSLMNLLVEKKGDTTLEMNLMVADMKKSDTLEARLPQVTFSIDSLSKMK